MRKTIKKQKTIHTTTKKQIVYLRNKKVISAYIHTHQIYVRIKIHMIC